MASSFSFDSLNQAQREAVGALDGPVMLLAGAGTGKTRTVTCRIAHMLEKRIDPSEILAVTFTNKAASESAAWSRKRLRKASYKTLDPR
jgi:DNA helicase-2/ATP-dependent DNA helicase PcrA